MKTPFAIAIAGALGALAGFVAGAGDPRGPIGDAPSFEAVSFHPSPQARMSPGASKPNSKSNRGIAARF